MVMWAGNVLLLFRPTSSVILIALSLGELRPRLKAFLPGDQDAALPGPFLPEGPKAMNQQPFGWFDARLQTAGPRTVRCLHADRDPCRCFMCLAERERLGVEEPQRLTPRQPWEPHTVAA